MQVSEQEASLTAKNYRLAKELSELRQKYKDIERKSTKLSMENHAIQSSWRLALVQIEDLKKELATYQKSQGERSTTKSNIPLHRESLISTYAANFESSSSVSPFSGPAQEKSPSLSLFDKTIDTSLFPPQDVSPLPSPMMTKGSYPNSGFDQTHSQRSKTTAEKLESPMEVVEESFNQTNNSSDGAFGELHKEDLFQPKSFSSNLPSTPEKENSNMNELNGQFDKFLSISTSENKKEDSFNAFEASFQTTFPPSFSSSPPRQMRSKISSEKAFQNADFGDSFFTAAQSSKEIDDVEKARRESNSPKTDIDAPMDEARDLFSSSTLTKSQTVVENQKVTTRTSRNIRNKSQANNSRISPQPVTHTPSSRSQFDNDNVIDAPMDEAQADESVHSPALVLKRLQQRKSKSSVTASKDLTEEMRKLDAIASTVSPRNENDNSNGNSNPRSSTRRRNVSQPISYAEPSLNTKLRRGDVFFQKKDRSDDESPTSVDELQTLKERQVPNMNPLLEM